MATVGAVTVEARFVELIADGAPFTADDLTDGGPLTLDSSHTPNAQQSGIGSMFSRASKAGRIEPTGNVVRSTAPHRKGGMIREWRATTAGQRWAQQATSWVP